MTNELIGVLENATLEVNVVLENATLEVNATITETGPRGLQGIQGPKGDKGDTGNDGYTPVKGVDYFDGIDGKDGEQGPKGDDGYTPIKGIDYFDGEKGDIGESGVYVGSGDMPEGYNVQIDPNGDGETLQDMIDSALLEAKNSGEFKGDTGEKGEKGTDGKDGYTPQKGVDYYTDADKAEMVSAVLDALPVYEGEVESV